MGARVRVRFEWDFKIPTRLWYKELWWDFNKCGVGMAVTNYCHFYQKIATAANMSDTEYVKYSPTIRP